MRPQHRHGQPPVVLEVTGGQIQLQNWTRDHQKVLLWHTKAVDNQWNDYVLRVSEDQRKGTIRFWFNGARQKLATGNGSAPSKWARAWPT